MARKAKSANKKPAVTMKATGLKKFLQQHAFGSDWPSDDKEVGFAIDVLVGLFFDLYASDETFGRKALSKKIESHVQKVMDVSERRSKEDLVQKYTKIVEDLERARPGLSRREPRVATNAGSRLSPSEDLRTFRTERLDELNAVLEKRWKAFSKLGDAWDQDHVVVRRAMHDYPKVAIGNEVDSDIGLVDVLGTLYGIDKKKISAWLEKNASSGGQRLMEMFSINDKGIRGSGMNDPAALLTRGSEVSEVAWWNDQTLSCWSTDWRRIELVYKFYMDHLDSIEAGHDTGSFARRPMVPGANAVPFIVKSSMSEGVLLQRRPADLMGGGNKGRLSLFGGAYQAKFLSSPHDHGSLRRTLSRELLEECGVVPDWQSAECFAAIEEVKKKSQIQFCALGVRVDSFDQAFLDAAGSGHSKEGLAEMVGADAFVDLLTRHSWELSCHGFAALLLWAAWGCPGASTKFKKVVAPVFETDLMNLLDFEQQAASAGTGKKRAAFERIGAAGDRSRK